MQIVKRDMSVQPFDVKKVTMRLLNLQRGTIQDQKRNTQYKLPSLEVSVTDLVNKIKAGICDNITSSQVDELSADVCASMCTVHPDYGTMAARIVVSDLHKKTEMSFSEKIKILYEQEKIVSKETYENVMRNKEVIESFIDYSTDYDFNYFGLKTLMKSYLLKADGKALERPQDMFMRVTVGIHKEDIAEIEQTYKLMSKRYFIHATPTLFNSGTTHPQMSSCFLLDIDDDSVQGIYSTLTKCAIISKHVGGLGVHIHKIRAKGSLIKGTGGTSNGIVPMLKVYDGTAKYVDQGGNKRPGSIAVYLEPWHNDIFEFLDLRKNTGKDEVRARDLFLGLWVPDLFMKRVEDDGEWSLFCPDNAYKEVNGKRIRLYEVYGKEFEDMYIELENQGKATRKVKAQSLWKAIVEAQIETGTPYLLYKDTCNARNNQKNLGTLTGSNLCTEILEYCTKDETAVCNLASIGLPTFLTKIEDDHDCENENIADNCKDAQGDDQKIDDNIANNNNDSNDDNVLFDSSSDKENSKRYKKEQESSDKHINNISSVFDFAYEQENKNKYSQQASLAEYTQEENAEDIESTEIQEIKLTQENDNEITQEVIANIILSQQNSQNPTTTTDDNNNAQKTESGTTLRLYKTEDGLYYINYNKIRQIASILTKNLNKIIDCSFYPISEAKTSNLKHRPIGIGVQGLADVFMILKIPFESEEAKKINKQIFENIYYGALEESNRLAQKYGKYESYEGSFTSEGLLQFDLCNETDLTLDWKGLKDKIKKHGLRNSLLIAPMPTASTSQILGFNECFEPVTSNIYTRRTLAGEFQIINKYLLKDLIKHNLWSHEMKNLLIQHVGSVQNIPLIPKNLREIYKTAWEIKMRNVIDMASERGSFIDQSQSMNLFVGEPTYSKITSMHFYGWKKGLKTGMYYLRTKPISTAIKFTVDKDMAKKSEVEMEEGFVCNNEEGCRSCSG
ncbi:ribonucleotide-diphosphate reductase subunit rnr1 [Binucleata daphniae]